MKRDFTLYIFLFISLATVLAFIMFSSNAIAEEAGAGKVLESLSEVKQPRFEASGEILRSQRDPFIPPEYETGIKRKPSAKEIDIYVDIIKDMRLSAIMRGNGSETAIINGYIIHAGDRIKEFIVERIEAGRVILTADNREYVLTLDSLVPGRFSDERGE